MAIGDWGGLVHYIEAKVAYVHDLSAADQLSHRQEARA